MLVDPGGARRDAGARSRARPRSTTSRLRSRRSRRSSRSCRCEQQVFAELTRYVGPDCILATNTSALSVSQRTPTSACTSHSGRGDPARRARPHGRHRRRRARHGVAASRRTCASTRCSSATRPGFVVNRVLTRMTSGSWTRSTRQHARRDRRGDAAARPADGAVPCCSRWSGRASRTTCSSRCTRASRPLRVVADARRLCRGRRRDRRRRGAARAASNEITRAVLEAVGDEIGHLLDAESSPIPPMSTLADPGDGSPFFLGGSRRTSATRDHGGVGGSLRRGRPSTIVAGRSRQPRTPSDATSTSSAVHWVHGEPAGKTKLPSETATSEPGRRPERSAGASLAGCEPEHGFAPALRRALAELLLA